MDITLDTGAEQTVVAGRTAKKLGLPVMGVTLSAGVGMVGMRGMQISKIDSIELGSLKVKQRHLPDQGAGARRAADGGTGQLFAARPRPVGDR